MNESSCKCGWRSGPCADPKAASERFWQHVDQSHTWTCLHCGTGFTLAGSGSVVYCSDACMAAHLLKTGTS